MNGNVEDFDASQDEPVSAELEQPETVPYDPARDREKMRGWLAVGLLVTLAVVAVVAFIAIAFGAGDGAKEALSTIWTPIVGLTGTVVGFYFGGVQSRNR